MSSITPRLLNDTLNLITLARETALARGQESQAARLTTVVDGLRQVTREAVLPDQTSDERKPTATGVLAASGFQALLAATQSPLAGPSSASAAGDRGLVAAAMAAGGMPEVDIARQLGITREEVRLMVTSQGGRR
jgi:hypothetical protein